MSKKALAVLVAIAIFCITGISYANEDCKALFDLYGKCYAQGKALKSLDKCKSLGDELFDELADESEGAVEEAISEEISNICDDACREAVDGEAKDDYGEFKERYCK